MDIQPIKHIFSKSNSASWTDTHSLTANNPYTNIFKNWIKNPYEYVIERIDAYGKILMADGSYRRLGPNDIDIYINGLNAGPNQASGQIYLPVNQTRDIGLGTQSGGASPDILFYYREFTEWNDSAQVWVEQIGTTTTITYTTYFRRVKSSNFN